MTEMAVQNSEIRQTALKPWALYRGGFVRDPVSREMGQGALVVRMRSENCKPKPEVLTGGSWSSQLLNPVGDSNRQRLSANRHGPATLRDSHCPVLRITMLPAGMP